MYETCVRRYSLTILKTFIDNIAHFNVIAVYVLALIQASIAALTTP